MRADGVLRDEQALGDVVGREVLVEQEEYLDLARRERAGDPVRNAAAKPAAATQLVEQAPRDLARERGLAVRDAAEERHDSLRRLALEQVAGRTGADGAEEVLLGAGSGEHDDLAAGCRRAQPGQRRQAVEAGHREIEQNEVRLKLDRKLQRFDAVRRLADDLEAALREQRRKRIARERMVVDDEDSLRHVPLIGKSLVADEGNVHRNTRDTFESWLVGELLLVALLGSATALFLTNPALRNTYELPEGRVVLDTAVVLAATIVAILAGVRFSVEGRVLDLLLAAGFFVAGVGTLAFSVLPVLGGSNQGAPEAWAGIAARVLAATLIALAPLVPAPRITERKRVLLVGIVVLLGALVAVWLPLRGFGARLSLLDASGRAAELTVATSFLALLALLAVLGFAIRYRARGEDLDSWLALGATLTLFAELHYVLTPPVSSDFISQGDFLRLLAYGLLLVGVWRAISFAEFGRAVAEERARVAREIHDGLAQYLFAVSTHASMLESGASLQQTLPKLKEAAAAAQQEARFAVLALSSASGTAPFDAALRRYVEFLTADGVLAVDVEIDPAILLAPDEQIEVFRIVQEGLANVRKHAGAQRAEVWIGQRHGRRIVTVSDDGVGFGGDVEASGQGLKNMRSRAQTIDGGFNLRSRPGRGTALEVVLRA